MATIDVKDAAGATVTIEKPLAPGRASAATSRPIAFSDEDFAVLDGIETAIASTNSKLDTLDGRVDGLETAVASTNTKLDTVIAKDFATQTTGAAILAKIIATPSTAAHQVTAQTSLTSLVAGVNHSTTGIGHGVSTVVTAGTSEVLITSTAAKWVIIQAQTDNTGEIAVGATGVDATEATGTGVLLEPGESITLACDNLADIFIDSTVNGEGVRFTYGT